MSATNGHDKTPLKVYDQHEPTYEQAKAFIGGWLEAVTLPNGDLLVIDEEGKIKGLPVNFFATVVWQEYFGDTDVIVGPAILIRKKVRNKHW